MAELLRTDTIFGKRANIVGDISADLVLESLGKIYIKSRNSAKTLEEVIKYVVLGDVEGSGTKALIVEGIEDIDRETLRDGLFIYDKLSNILYLWLDGELIELINVAPEGTGYVKRSGDTMTGRLTINVPNGAPLHVNSTSLVKNLNANYLLGLAASAFALKAKDENITGNWTFRSPTKFEANVGMGQDLIINGSIGTPDFASGFGGFGWRMDADTNTLTVDNLVVRKLMQVYELVVNKISATNGSLWVTNAGKVTKCLRLPIITADHLSLGNADSTLRDLLNITSNNAYFAVFPQESGNMLTLSGDTLIASSGINRNTATLTTYTTDARKEAYVVQITDNSAIGHIDGSNHYVLNTGLHYKDGLVVSDVLVDTAANGYRTFKLYADDFNHDITFPIIPRDYYLSFKLSELYRKLYEADRIKDNSVSESTYINTARYKSVVWPGNSYSFLEASDVIAYIRSYYKYFSEGDFYIVQFDKDELTVYKA